MFDKYQNQASATFKEHEALEPLQARFLNWGLGLGGEAGEVQEVIKHYVFGKEPLDKMKLAKEMGDVLWYLAALCTTADMELSAVAELNMHKLNHRYNGGGYDKDASADRHASEKRFEDTFIYKCLEAKINHTPAPVNVIFVGPDGSGKTTISKAVAEKLAADGFTYHKCDYRQEDKPELSKRLMSEAINVIYDRFYYPDDIIYSRVTHERTSEEPMDWETSYWKKYNDVLTLLCELNTVYIYVTADAETLKQRSSTWADDYITVEDLNKIRCLYDRWSRFIVTRPIVLFELDTTDKPVDECVQECVDNIRRAQAVFANQDMDTYLERREETDNV